MSDIDTQSDVTQDTGAASSDNSASSAPSQEPSTQEASTSTPQDGNVPFNDPKHPMHSRFQELIDKNKASEGRLSQYEQRMQQMEQQYQSQMQQLQRELQASRPQQPKPFQTLFEELKGINPEFATMQEKAWEAAQLVPALQQELSSMKQERDRQVAYSQLENLYTANKVPKDLQGFYEQAIKTKAYELGPRASLQDIPNLFKDAHEQIQKFISDRDRQTRSSFVAEKKKDATPGSTTGGVPAGTAKQPMPRDEFIKWAASELRKGKSNI